MTTRSDLRQPSELSARVHRVAFGVLLFSSLPGCVVVMGQPAPPRANEPRANEPRANEPRANEPRANEPRAQPPAQPHARPCEACPVIADRPSRETIRTHLQRFDEFVRRCTSGPHRVYAVATITFAQDGSVAYSEIDTGDAEADGCATRLLDAMRIPAFEQGPFTVRFPFRVRAREATHVRRTSSIEAAMEFEPDLCAWGASRDRSCRDEREAAAMDCD